MHAPKPVVYFAGITFTLFAVGAAETARSFDHTAAKATGQAAGSILNALPDLLSGFHGEHTTPAPAAGAPAPAPVAAKTAP